MKSKRLDKIFDYKLDSLIKIYLGMPLFVGSIKASYWENLVNKIKGNLMGWKNKTLSYVRRLSLIKHMLQSMPII